MSFAAPFALLGLLSLPVLWWLHVRRKRPVAMDIPSLMFVQDEDEHTRLPRGRRVDWELLLTLVGATLLTLGAAGPRWQSERAHRIVRVVVVGGALATRGLGQYEERVARTLDTIGSALESGDRVDVVWVPERDPHDAWRMAPRPGLDRILGTARAGEATVRYVIDDRLPAEMPDDVRWIAHGMSRGDNPGILSARVVRDEDGPRLFVVAYAAGGILGFTVSYGAETKSHLRKHGPSVITTYVPFDDAERISVALKPRADNPITVDDEVILTRARIRAHVEPQLPKGLRESLEAALDAATGGTVQLVAREQAQIVFGTKRPDDSATWFVGFTFAPTNAPPVALPAGDDRISSDPLARDLEVDGMAWRFPAMPDAADETTLLLGRVVRGRTWPVLVRDGGTSVRLLALPPPRQAPFWPLFVQNVLDTMGGRDAGGGYRIRGVLDPAVTHYGRDVTLFEPSALRAVPPDRTPARIDLRALCLALALLVVAALWLLPAFRRPQNAWTPATAE